MNPHLSAPSSLLRHSVHDGDRSASGVVASVSNRRALPNWSRWDARTLQPARWPTSASTRHANRRATTSWRTTAPRACTCARQQAEVRAAAASASEARAADLLAILELNRNGADRALEQLRSAKDAQRREFAGNALRSLLRHLVARRLRQALARWRSRSGHHQLDGHSAVVEGRNGCCEVRTADPPAVECTFAFDECFRLRFARRRELRAVAFAAWKSLARQRRLQLASCRRWRARQLLAACVSSWRSCLERRARARAVMKRLVAKQTRRTLCKARMTLRHACVRENATLWVQALDAARRAVNEEREQLIAERYEALKQAHDARARDQSHIQRFSELYSHKLASLAHDDIKQRYFSRWKLQAAQAVRTRAAALRLARSRHWQQRGAFNAWRRVTKRSRALRDASGIVATRSTRRRLTLAFKSLATHATVVKRQRVALKRLVHRFMTTRALSRAWRRWHIYSTLESQRLLANYDAQQLTDRFDIREAMLQHELQRATKLRRQAQLACALHMRDRRCELSLRSAMNEWTLVARVQARRRRHPQRLLDRLSDSVKRRAISQWHQRATAKSRRLARISALERRGRTRRVREVFSAWRLTFCRDRRVHFDHSTEALRCRLSRIERDQVQQRGVALYRLLYRRWLIDARQQAFMSWKRRVDQQTWCETLGMEERNASMAVVWTAWRRYCRHRLRARARQYQVVCDKMARREQTLTRKRVLFAAWRSEANHSKNERRRITQQFATLRRGRERLATSFKLWCHWRLDRKQRRCALVATLCRRRLQRVVRLHWQQWTRHSVASAVQEAQRLTRCRAKNHRRTLVLRLLASRQRQLTLRLIWGEWNALVKVRRRTAAKSSHCVTFVERQRLLKLRRECFQRWRDAFMALNERARRALRVLLRQTSRRQTLRAFRDWQRQSRSIAAFSLHDDHTRANRLAEERIASIAAVKRESRTRQRAFTAWKALVTQQRTHRRGCSRLMRRYAVMRTRIAWKHWLVLTRVSRHLDRLAMLLSLSTRRLAWALLVSSRSQFVKEQQRVRSLKFVVGTWRRWQLRSGWNDWKTQTVLTRRAQIQTHQREIASSVTALMDKRRLHWASRWHRRSAQRHVLRCWRAYIARRRFTHAALNTARSKRLSAMMTAWQSWAKREKKVAQTLHQLARSMERHELRHGMVQWRSQCHISRVASARRAVLVRVLSAPSPSSIRSLNWCRPWLMACFAAWRSLCLRRQCQFRVLATRHSMRLTRSMFHAWRRLVWTAQQIVQFSRERQRRLVSSLFHQWKRRTQQLHQHLEGTLEGLVLVIQRSLWRQGWQALRAHHGRETMRRQSALAFQSAQSVIDQHRRALAMRSAALMLARRQRLDASALFQRWKSFVVTRQQDHQVEKATNARMTRFRVHAAVAKWHLATHLEVLSRRSVQRWQKTRRKRQLQRCWRDWIAFVDDLRARKRGMTGTINMMLARSVGYRLKRAWGTWTASTVELRDRERQRRLDASNERVLLLVSSRSQLEQQHAGELRRRSLEFFAATLATVLTRALQSNVEASKARAFDHWKNNILIVRHRAIASLLAVVTSHVRRSTLICWREFARKQRTADEVKQHRQRTFERAAVLFASATTQTRKRRVMLTWQAYALTRRTKQRQRALMVATISRGLARATRRRCFRSWTCYVHVSVNRQLQLSKFSAILRR